MKTNEFDYSLPEELIAQKPAEKRDMSRLMAVKEKIEHKRFNEIIDYLNKDDVLVLNETKVIEAKLIGSKVSGSPAEVILTKRIDNKRFKARIKTKNPKIGTEMIFNDIRCRVLFRDNDIFTIEFEKELFDEDIKKIAVLPTPPYIKEKMDYSRYQTVYAEKEGSVAAPTAGLHFTPELLKRIEEKGVKIAKLTLHVGFGTFIPIRSEDIEEHQMEEEYFEIDAVDKKIINECKGRLVCVGTTSMRALESMCENGKIVKYSGITDLFIYPGYEFQSKVSMLITNFHLPKSTLLLLVSAFAGKDVVFNAYKEAIKEKYRFYSFGDAMLFYQKL